VARRVDDAAPKESPQAVQARADDDEEMAGGGGGGAGAAGRAGGKAAGEVGGAAGNAAATPFAAPARRQPRGEVVRMARPGHPPTAIEQVVGVILGSPEFQRR
jgi:hypothetical protein